MTSTTPYSASNDRLLALRAFDASKSGVKGLVDSGITSLPSFFLHQDIDLSSTTDTATSLSIPTVDLSLPRAAAVDAVRAAAGSAGFFHVVNHGVPLASIENGIEGVRGFNELDFEARSRFYSRQSVGGVNYASNFDLYRAKAASWRDTVQILLSPVRPDPERIPELFREEILLLDEQLKEVARLLMGMLAEGLGLESERLETMTCCDGRMMVCHYYPWCPEPDKTVGLTAHTDPGVVTVLVQDKVGGLQVKLKEGWVDVEPMEEALLVNIGDLLQIISNDEYKSVEHRVKANSRKEARVSISIFFNPAKRGESDFYGPLPELATEGKPAVYRNFTMQEFMGTFFSKGLASKALVDYFKL